jgi:hypothetical protein
MNKSNDLIDFMQALTREMENEYQRIQKRQEKILGQLVIKEKKIGPLCLKIGYLLIIK